MGSEVTDGQIKAELGAEGGKHPGFLQGYLCLSSWDSLVLGGTADQSVTAMPSMLLLGTAHFAGTSLNGIIPR